MGEIVPLEAALEIRTRLRDEGRRVAFTNGVFDILHRGHCEYLQASRAMGDVLIIGLNSDASVRRIKGELKPIVPEADRAAVLCALASVDYVVLFDGDTPHALISALLPDVLIKGADYDAADIVGAKEVLAAGGEVKTVALTPGRSSTNVVQTIIERYCSNRI